MSTCIISLYYKVLSFRPSFFKLKKAFHSMNLASHYLKSSWFWSSKSNKKFTWARSDFAWVKQNHSMIIGICQCCILRNEIWECNECGFFGHLLDLYRKIFLTSLSTSHNKSIWFCFFPYLAVTMTWVFSWILTC